MGKMTMCDALGRAHELVLALEKAGLSDEGAQDIINAKDNALAEAMVDTYLFIVGQKMFELVSEFEFETPDIIPSELMDKVGRIFLRNESHFDKRAFNIYQKSSQLQGGKKALLFENIVPVSEKVVRSFIKSKGSFPGVFGLVSAWYSTVIVAGQHNFPEAKVIFSFEEKEISSASRLVNLGITGGGDKPNYHLDVRNINKVFNEGNYFLVLQDLEG